jgi:hypothetical protein
VCGEGVCSSTGRSEIIVRAEGMDYGDGLAGGDCYVGFVLGKIRVNLY